MSLEDRITELEEKVRALSTEFRALSTTGGSGPSDTMPLEKLQNDWADKNVKKVPSNWNEKHDRDVTGMAYSSLTPQELKDLAGYYEWKAKKGREEVPVRVKDNGKPWHESDTFEAKLLRTWALAKSGATPSKAATPYGTTGHGANAKHTAPPEPGFDDFARDNEEIPF